MMAPVPQRPYGRRRSASSMPFLRIRGCPISATRKNLLLAHRGGRCARVVQRHHAGQQHLVVLSRRRHHQRRHGDHADRRPLLGGSSYDDDTGLGTPNGLLLARALSAIADEGHVSFLSSPAMLEQDGSGGWATPVGETLLVQTMLDDPAAGRQRLAGGHSLDFTGMASGTFA